MIKNSRSNVGYRIENQSVAILARFADFADAFYCFQLSLVCFLSKSHHQHTTCIDACFEMVNAVVSDNFSFVDDNDTLAQCLNFLHDMR